MKQDMIIYPRSQQLVKIPKFRIVKKYNDYGQVFPLGIIRNNIKNAGLWEIKGVTGQPPLFNQSDFLFDDKELIITPQPLEAAIVYRKSPKNILGL